MSARQKAQRSVDAVRLADYRPPPYTTRATDLEVTLDAADTRVVNTMQIERRVPGEPLVLDGQELELESVSVDGRPLTSNEYAVTADSLTLYDLPERATVQVVTRIRPEANSALEGLYRSSGMYCTQCEAEGFRKITYYQDRPDVLSVFTTSIIASSDYPVLLSNGNLVADELLEDGRRKVTWHDPFPKPSYLFALVAGDLAVLEDSFVTASGRSVALKIYSEPHNIDQCGYAMEALKRAMRWDEEAYGREYDLDVFMIVAVDDFNMGAMENKGLNVFNTSCVLATPETATDQAYQRVEGVVAHEYFHNWSGNRVTCRDWFQLSLKEGFTVFRDAEFSADMNSRTVKRIEDVNRLRAVQFAEDSSPLAHPVRPTSYIEISNFYTPTVYEKGAEVVRMVHTILGAPAFRTGSDEYFRRHDGAAVTTEDFLAAMRDTSGKDLGQFQRWYDQAGTPTLRVQSRYEAGTLTLSVAQSCPDTPGQSAKAPFHIPVLLGLLDRDGSSLVSRELRWDGDCEVERRDDSLLLHLRDATAGVRFTGLPRQPEVSFLRGFSAPVRVDFPRPAASLAFLAEHDPDGFAAWDALQTLLVAELTGHERGRPYAVELLDSIGRLLGNALGGPLDDPERNFVLAAKLSLPSESYLFEQVERIDVERLCAARDTLGDALARTHVERWEALLEASASDGPYAPEARSMSRRALHHTALGYLARVLDPADLEARLAASFDAADNLSDRRALLGCAVDHLPDSTVTATLLDRFYKRWQGEALVVNQWLAVQAAGTHCDASRLAQLVAHPAFTLKNPNKVRAVLGTFAGLNARNFHAADGSGYEYLADRVLELDGVNPQMASALAKPLARWRRYKGPRARLMSGVVKRIAAEPSLSKDVYEVVSKALL